MSLAALLEATLTHLQKRLGLDEAHIGIEEDGQPPPWCGDVYYAIHPTSWTPDTIEPDKDLDERFGLAITVTQRTPQFPQGKQRMKGAYLDAVKGLERRTRDVMLAIHLNYDLFGAANEIMKGTVTLCEPLRWLGTDARPTKVDALWFTSDAPDPTSASGLVLESRFGNARRIQRIYKFGDADVLD